MHSGMALSMTHKCNPTLKSGQNNVSFIGTVFAFGYLKALPGYAALQVLEQSHL